MDDYLPVDIRALNISLSINNNINTNKSSNKSNFILDSVSVHLPSGKLTAILGGSGSGKAILSGRLKSNSMVKLKGKILFNTSTVPPLEKISLVQQQDFLLPYLTVYETLQYAASLRLFNLSHSQRSIVVDEVVSELGLTDVANTIIGDRLQRGISGGEKRRTSIGVQLLTNPSVLFLDEPTSGLDAFTSVNIVNTLLNLARKGRTVVTSIHQPRSDIFQMFDCVIILSRGRLIYSGPMDKLFGYFSSLRYEIPTQNVNPADYLIDISTIDNRSIELESSTKANIQQLIVSWEMELKKSPILDPDTESVPYQKILSQESLLVSLRRFFSCTIVLTRRSWTNLVRDRVGTFGHFIESILIGVIIGYIYIQLPLSEAGLRSRAGASYSVIGLQPYLLLILNIYRLSDEMKIFDRERADNMYQVLPYLLSNFISTFIPYTLAHFLFMIVSYFMMGFRTDNAVYFGWFVLANTLHLWCGISFAWMCVAVSREFPVSSLLANTMISFLTMTCGFFISVKSLPVYIKWIRWISSYSYSLEMIVSAELSDRDFGCPFASDDPRCLPYQGNYFLGTLGFSVNNYSKPALMMCAIWAVTALITFLLLTFRRPATSKLSVMVGGNNSANSTNQSNTFHSNKISPVEDIVTSTNLPYKIDIKIKNLKMNLRKKGLKLNEIKILDNVDAEFLNGKLNIILGGSGCGKSSLLNLLAGRLHNGLLEEYKFEGSVIWSDENLKKFIKPSRSSRKVLMGYVTQDDDRLLPSLTVRETLHYAACLRLPAEEPRQKKIKIAEEILLSLGLKDCADTLVGNSIIKGISGGEKRRLSIGVQLLQDPYILLLDEPTTGLDAFSARSVMQLLKNLANGKFRGKPRTVICTIHQPRSDIYEFLDNILLLARGGKTVYSGPRETMLDYFKNLNFECPKMTNPADFVLDISSIDLRTPEKEEESRTRVEQLLNMYKSHRNQKILESQEADSSLEIAKVKNDGPSFLNVFPILLSRSFKNIFRQIPLVISRVSQFIAYGLVLTVHFARLSHDNESVQTRFGVIQEQLMLMFVGLLNNLAVYPQERNNFYMEYSEGVVSIGAFQMTYLLNELPFEIFSSVVFVMIVDWLGGFRVTADIFFANALISLCLCNIGESIGIVFCTFFDHVGIAVSFTNLVLSLLGTMSGIMSLDMPALFKYIDYIAPTWYAARVMVTNEFSDISFTCDESQLIPGEIPRCPIQNGQDAMALYKFDPVNVNTNLGIIFGLTVIYRLISYVIMVARLSNKGEQ